ncbi:MAG: serine/threonine protein kinase [Spirochaetales bacterium]|nr:serine/threonine protein kinase [Spirochaetales bacterium]
MGKTAIGKYEIIEKLKEGGMGTIYKAIHPTLGKPVILKELTLGSSHILIERFKREAKIMINLRNDYIVPVHDHFKDSHSYYLVMEYVDGCSLEDLLRKFRKLKPEAALIILYQVCRGLKYAHDKGIVHRDIKPDNILLSKNGEVKIVDFGIATALAANDEDLTATGTVIGTPAYMSPEQLKDSKYVDKQTDIYALGVVLYQMLTGSKPFASNFAGETVQRIKRGKYEHPHKLNSHIPAVCVRMIRKLMHCRKKKRYADLGDVIDKLVKLLQIKKNGKTLLPYLRSYISAGDAKCPINMNKKQFARRSSFGTAAVLVIVVAAFWGFVKTGWYSRLLQRKTNGAAEISLAGTSGDNLQNYPGPSRLDFLPDLGKTASSRELHLILDKNRYFWKSWDLSGGYYMFSGLINDVFYFKTFFLMPYEMMGKGYDKYTQVQLPDFSATQEDREITCRDAFNSRRIFDASVGISRKGKELDINEDFSFKAGISYDILVEHEGYYSFGWIYTHNFGKFSADISLVPLPGILNIESNSDDLEILIDNEKGGFIGRKNRVYSRYGYTSKNGRTFYLPVGKHSVTVRKGNNAEQTMEIDLEYDQKKELSVVYNNTDRTLQLR